MEEVFCLPQFPVFIGELPSPLLREDYKKALRAPNGELQLHLLALADVLVEHPSQYARRVEDIFLIFKNLHHPLNSLRPHQDEGGGAETSQRVAPNSGWAFNLRVGSPMQRICYACPTTLRDGRVRSNVFFDVAVDKTKSDVQEAG